MNYAALVQVGQPRGCVRKHASRFANRQFSAIANNLPDGTAGYELHGDEMKTVGFAPCQSTGDVGVGSFPADFQLVKEPIEFSLLSQSCFGWQHFQRNEGLIPQFGRLPGVLARDKRFPCPPGPEEQESGKDQLPNPASVHAAVYRLENS